MSSESKKILIITYYWPPAGGPGVQRWLKFVKYLPEFGWEPVVFIPENPSYPIVDETLQSEVSEDLKVIKTKILEPYQIAEFFGKDNKKFKAGQFDVGQNQSWKSKLSIWIRGNFFIPDARVFWVKPSVKFLRKYLKENHIDALVTTGPPHSLHLIGLQLKKEFPDMKWMADFRDPWTEISYYQHLKLTKKSDLKHRKLEEKVFKNADITLATSFTDAENFRHKGANAICITNGFDTEIQNKSELKRNEKFTLSYIGVLEQLRNPEVLWQVLNEIITENQEFRDYFELKFVGRIDDKIIKKIQNTPLHNTVNNLGYLSHSESNKEMQKSDVLMVTNFPNEKSKGIIPGKIFEYLATGKTVLSFGPKGADVARILEETKAGHHFNFDQKEEVKSFLLQQFEFWKNNEIQRNPSRIDQYSRRNLTHRLSEIL
ncbi:glycosyl transferase family 1 [Chryseobacterium lacus]|uniref:Glycosyl transferase family 1 n=1 Tax=Chryseobacterium lacus TaxID=2058346 RepID=A0A368MZ39_9FLAO|nr:glycosyl transferase family 1 [Chryseobacterium lacus]RCU42664.1 glycosyl transferase family 1 [Chryseobacterium lacus]RST27221.1 glycosyl transferase family 1 [Chryseobacterium lacus]